MKTLRVVLVAIGYIAAAACFSVVAARWPPLARATHSEAIHIPAHMLMYGGLTLLAYRAGVRVRTAGIIAISVGAIQELAQSVALKIMPGTPGLFDLAVDSVAVVITVALIQLRLRRSTAL